MVGDHGVNIHVNHLLHPITFRNTCFVLHRKLFSYIKRSHSLVLRVITFTHPLVLYSIIVLQSYHSLYVRTSATADQPGSFIPDPSHRMNQMSDLLASTVTGWRQDWIFILTSTCADMETCFILLFSLLTASTGTCLPQCGNFNAN